MACANGFCSHWFEGNIQRKVSPNLSTFLRFLERTFFRKSLVQSKRSDRFQPGKILKIIEHVSCSVRYCKISLFTYSGSSSLSNAGPFFTHFSFTKYFTNWLNCFSFAICKQLIYFPGPPITLFTFTVAVCGISL